MENQEDIDEMTLEIMQDENLTWIEKKVAIAMIAIWKGGKNNVDRA